MNTMKFKNKRNGVILEPNSEIVAEQLMKEASFGLCQPGSRTRRRKVPGEDEQGRTSGSRTGGRITVPDDATKAEIVELIKAAQGDE